MRIASVLTFCLPAVAVAQVFVPSQELDLGTVREADGVVVRHVMVVNDRPDTLAAVDVKSSCGCITADIAPKVILPADTALLRIEYNPRGAMGDFSKNVIIRWGDDTAPKSVIRVKGNTIMSAETMARRFPAAVDSVMFSSLDVTYEHIDKPAQTNWAIRAYNNYADRSVSIIFPSLPPQVTAKALLDPLPPGGMAVIMIELSADKLKNLKKDTSFRGRVVDSADGSKISDFKVKVNVK